MKVSVITACYNSAETIGSALDSVARQTHREIEHIVVDGGSTDGTLELIKRHGTVTKMIGGPDRGLYDALNKGIAASSGEVVAFLHSDDVYAAPDIVERVARQMGAQSLDALYGDVAFFRGSDPNRIVRVYSSRRFHPSRIGWGWMPAHPSLFVSRWIYEKYGTFKTDYEIAADFEFVARVFSRPSFRYAYQDQVLVKMRMGGISTRGLRSALIINRETIRACRENNIPTNYLKIMTKYPSKLMEFLRLAH